MSEADSGEESHDDDDDDDEAEDDLGISTIEFYVW